MGGWTLFRWQGLQKTYPRVLSFNFHTISYLLSRIASYGHQNISRFIYYLAIWSVLGYMDIIHVNEVLGIPLLDEDYSHVGFSALGFLHTTFSSFSPCLFPQTTSIHSLASVCEIG